MKEENIIEELKRKVEEGGQVTREEALVLSRVEDKKALYEAAGAIRDRFAGRYFDTCSIVNAVRDVVPRIVSGVRSRPCSKRTCRSTS